MFAAGFLHGHINNSSIKESSQKGTEMSSKIIQKIELDFIKFFGYALFPFFGLITLFLYFAENKSLANLFLFSK